MDFPPAQTCTDSPSTHTRDLLSQNHINESVKPKKKEVHVESEHDQEKTKQSVIVGLHFRLKEEESCKNGQDLK